MSLSVQSIGVRQNPSLGLAQQNQSPSFKADMRPIIHNTNTGSGGFFSLRNMLALAGAVLLIGGMAAGLLLGMPNPATPHHG